MKSVSVTAVDLFCGVGGLTYGLQKAGVNVRMGVDIDPACEYPYTANNKAKFLLKSVDELSAAHINNFKKKGTPLLLAGCAPCQPFSKYRQGARSKDSKWYLLNEFSRLIRESKPDLVTMENVPGLTRRKIFNDFVKALKAQRYFVFYKVVNCADYGVPQYRRRLVLLASKMGPIELIAPTRDKTNYSTVRDAISHLKRLKAGASSKPDSLHKSCALSDLNLSRIQSSKPGGSWRQWNRKLVSACHKRKTGQTYPSVYGRMEWDKLAPTITTQFYGFGNGRFGHPIQNRALSLREGAILQSFPKKYKFVAPRREFATKNIGRLIGNAVPVRLGEVIGKSIVNHLKDQA